MSGVPFKSIVEFIGRSSKRIAVTVVGFTLLAAGLAGLVVPILPGPLFILAGLAVLATEYMWARRALVVAKDKARKARARAGRFFRRKPKPPL